MARLVVESGPDTGREFPLGDVAVIGRLPTVQVALSDMNTSREHTRVLHQGNDWFLVDLGSRNGTLVNGKNIQRHKLAQGDRVGVGKTVMRFEADGGKAPPAEVPEATSTPTEPLPLTHVHARAAPPPKATAAPPKVEARPAAPVEKAPAAPVKKVPSAPVEKASVAPVEKAPAAPVEKAPPVPKPAGPATRALAPQTKPMPKREVAADKAPLAVSANRAVALSGGMQALLVAGAILVALSVLAATWWVGTKMFSKVMEKPAPVRKK